MVWYIYELVNLMGGVEWVGCTIDTERRFNQHTKKHPNSRSGSRNNGHGRFYGRLDMSMHIVAIYASKAEALLAEHELQIFWELETDKSKRSMAGSKNGRAKLTEDQVRQIKSLLSKNLSCGELGRRFNTGAQAISKIKNGRNWAHIK